MCLCNNFLLKHVFGVLGRSISGRRLLQAHRVHNSTGITFLKINHLFVVPTLFFKKTAKGTLLSPPSSVRLSLSVMLSPPKPLDEIQPNLVFELLT